MVSGKIIKLFILFLIIPMLFQCKGKEEYIRLLTFKGSQVGRSLDFYPGFHPLDSLGYGNVVIRNGDGILANDFYFSVRRDLPDTLHFHQLDSLMYINGNLAGISISENTPPPLFFHQLSAKEISHLRTIQFEKPIGDSVKPYLKKIAVLNPVVDIIYSSEVDSIAILNRDLLWLSQYFHPRALLIENETDSNSFSTIAGFSSLETLSISLPVNAKDRFTHLPPLPHLKELILFGNDNSTFIDSGFFRKNHDLEGLAIFYIPDGNIDWASLHQFKNLRHLHINSDGLISHDIYRHHPHLKSLHLSFHNGGGSISSIFQKNQLKWLSLYSDDAPFLGQNPKVLQNSFPQLEYLEFENYDSLLDYRNFENFKKLKYLVVYGNVGLDSTLHNMDHLRYLSLSEDFLKDSINVVKLQRALPTTIITPNSGACLGSGWLLLIIPLAGLWFYFLKPNKPVTQ